MTDLPIKGAAVYLYDPSTGRPIVGGNSSNISSIGGTAITAGQDTDGAHSLPVVLPSGLSILVSGAMTGTLQSIPGTTGGLSIYRANVPNNNTGVVVKASPGQLYAVGMFNNSAVVAYLKFYDKATAPTVGTDPVLFDMMFPAPAAGGGGVILPIANGAAFPTGISYGVVTDFADNGTTAPAANAYKLVFFYK